ncbi:MAG: class I mannose-6-phosphate isomerase [Pirellulales bacterium]|nr:class I mannose-6-phosphate isomerase [Pirellulales bacterium]
MLYPLRLHPVLKQYVWGGRRLGAELGKPVPAGETCAESWEVCDRRTSTGVVEQSRVMAGPLAGVALADLVDRYQRELLGRHAPQSRFPLILKLLDTAQPLSVQVHPDDARAARLDPPDAGKTEAWYVLAADPGAAIYAGLRRGFDQASFARELARGTCELCLERLEPRPGDCIFVPAGLIHALGAGLLVVEIQQSSDTTFRLFDWNRKGPDGQPRPLHVMAGLEALDDRLGPGRFVQPRATDRAEVQRLVDCDKFVLDRWELTAKECCGGDDRCHLLMVVEGSVCVAGDAVEEPLARGGTMLLPACLPGVEVTPVGRAVLLDAYLP